MYYRKFQSRSVILATGVSIIDLCPFLSISVAWVPGHTVSGYTTIIIFCFGLFFSGSELIVMKLSLTTDFHFLYVDDLLAACLTSRQHASVSRGLIGSVNFTCCHTEIDVADQTFHLTQSQYTDTRPTRPSSPGAQQGSY